MSCHLSTPRSELVMIYFLWTWQMKDIWWVCTLVSPANLGVSHSSSFPYAVSPACLLPKCWERLHLHIQGRSSSISLVVSVVANINHSILSVLCGITSYHIHITELPPYMVQLWRPVGISLSLLCCAATLEYGPSFVSPVCVGPAYRVLRECQGGGHRSVETRT